MQAESKVIEDGKDLHISGEPGIGKTRFLRSLQDRLDGYNVEEKRVRRQHGRADLFRDLLHTARREAVERDSKPNQLISASGGFASFSGGGAVDDRVRDIQKLEDLTEGWSGKPLVLCVDDIHKIAGDERTVRDIIGEISSALGENVHLVSAGQVSALDIPSVEQIHISYFTYRQTQRFLKARFGDLSEETIREVHSKVGGHPLYLDMLTASSEEEGDFDLPEEKVFETIERRYIESLPAETERFLRRVAPLPELNEKLVASVLEDRSRTEVSRCLRGLERKTVLQKVNRTDDGNRVYKVNQHFRDFLLRKNSDPPRIRRKAISHHFRQVLELGQNDVDDAWISSLPHAFNIQHHINELHNDLEPEHLQKELDHAEIEYPERAVIIGYGALTILGTDLISFLQLEHSRFSEWLLEETEDNPVAELISQFAAWFLSQFDDEDSMDLEEIQVEASLDDLPDQTFEDMEISEEQAQHLHQGLQHMLSFFFEEEPHQTEEYRRYAQKTFQRYGISPEVLKQLRKQIKTILVESSFSDEAGELLDTYFDSLETELQQAVTSSLDTYELRELSLQTGRELFDSVHSEALFESGLMSQIAVECGKVLEDAENPAFALAWYSFFITYFQENTDHNNCLGKLNSRFEQMIDERKSYEEQIDQPMFSAKDSEKPVKLEIDD